MGTTIDPSFYIKRFTEDFVKDLKGAIDRHLENLEEKGETIIPFSSSLKDAATVTLSLLEYMVVATIIKRALQDAGISFRTEEVSTCGEPVAKSKYGCKHHSEELDASLCSQPAVAEKPGCPCIKRGERIRIHPSTDLKNVILKVEWE